MKKDGIKEFFERNGITDDALDPAKEMDEEEPKALILYNRRFKMREYREGHWQVRFQHEGKRVSITRMEDGTPLTSKSMAWVLKQHLLREGYDPRRFGKDKEFHFDVAVKTWISLSECCEEALYERKRIVDKFLLPYFGKDDFRDIKTIHVLAFWKTLKEKGQKPSYQKNIMKELKSFFHFNRDSLTKMPEFPRIKVQTPMVKILTPEEQDLVFTRIPKRHLKIFWFMRIYPVRPEEACGLRWTDFRMDFKIPFFIIQNVVSRNGVFKEQTKTNRVRPYPIIPGTEWLFQRNGDDGNEFAFIRQNGKPHSSGSLYAIWQAANKQVDVPRVSLYGAMKHSRGWDLIDRGLSLEDVGLLMGHSPGSKDTRRYAGQTLKRMLEMLGDVPKSFPGVKEDNLLEYKAKSAHLPSSRV